MGWEIWLMIYLAVTALVYKGRLVNVEKVLRKTLNSVEVGNSKQSHCESELMEHLEHWKMMYRQEKIRADHFSFVAMKSQPGVMPLSESQFSQDEIKRLIRLCHPDKHQNSDSANEMLKKLLALKH